MRTFIGAAFDDLFAFLSPIETPSPPSPRQRQTFYTLFLLSCSTQLAMQLLCLTAPCLVYPTDCRVILVFRTSVGRRRPGVLLELKRYGWQSFCRHDEQPGFRHRGEKRGVGVALGRAANGMIWGSSLRLISKSCHRQKKHHSKTSPVGLKSCLYSSTFLRLAAITVTIIQRNMDAIIVLCFVGMITPRTSGRG